MFLFWDLDGKSHHIRGDVRSFLESVRKDKYWDEFQSLYLFLRNCYKLCFCLAELRLLAVCGFLLSSWGPQTPSQWALLRWRAVSRARGRQSWWRTGLAAAQHVGSSQTRDGTHIPCTGSWILYHWASREAPEFYSSLNVPRGLPVPLLA